MESIGICAGEMELNIYIFLKGKLKPEVELIYVMSDRSNLKLSRLQIYRANEILLLFSRSILKRDQSPWTNQMHPFILVLIILQKTLIKVDLKPMQWELTNFIFTYARIPLFFFGGIYILNPRINCLQSWVWLWLFEGKSGANEQLIKMLGDYALTYPPCIY